MKYSLTALLLFVFTLVTAQQHFIIQDSLTKAPVPYASVNLLNNFGLYADANGNFKIADTLIKQVEISSMGYAAKKVSLKNKTGVLYLSPEPFAVEEVIVNAEYVKPDEKVIRPKGHQNNPKMAVSRMGMQYAVYIPGTGTDSFISRLALPLMKNDFVFNYETRKSVFIELPYKTLVKIAFLDSNNGIPGERFSDFEQVVVIGGGDQKLFEVELTQNVALPSNGIFVTFIILGKADDAGNLTNELSYDEVVYPDGRRERSWKQQQPNFPLYEVSKGQVPTFTRSSFDFDTVWRAIDKPLTFNPAATFNGFAVGIGYTLLTYK